MKLIIAEKPSVAREIAAVLGLKDQKEGYISGKEYQVTWALGHLVTLALPQHYGIEGFSRESLPVLPDPFALTPRKIRTGKGYTDDPTAIKQLGVIKKLCRTCESIIVATDAGREGELIFRYIYDYIGCKKPFQRLWISSLTEQAIRRGMADLRPGKDFDNLYHAALCRSRADWLIGINATQALTLAIGNRLHSLGRVQAPTLALICKRYWEHTRFQAKSEWRIVLKHRKVFTDFCSISSEKWADKKEAERVLKDILKNGQVYVQQVEKKSVVEQSPLLFDLTGLQKEANDKLGLTAAETLEAAQYLYEQKFISYPRTGSRHIPEDLWKKIPGLILALGEFERYRTACRLLTWGRLNRHIVNELKVTDHHGLLITGIVPDAISGKERAVYDMIAFRLLEALSSSCVKEKSTVLLKAGIHEFSVKGSKITVAGWRAIQGSPADNEEHPEPDLPVLPENSCLKINDHRAEEIRTKAPLLYNEATLLSAMENAGRHARKEEEKDLPKTGLGTPATRAAIIETLLDRAYIKREKKTLYPTEKGLLVYDITKEHLISRVDLTVGWEKDLLDIEQGKLEYVDFLKKIENYTKEVTAEFLNTCVPASPHPKISCPKCKSNGVSMGDKAVKCSGDQCDWVLYRNICGVFLKIEDVEELILKGKTRLFQGMKTFSGSRVFNAYITLGPDAKTSFEFPPKKSKL